MAIFIVILVSLALFLWIFWPAFLGAPYIPLPLSCVKRMLNLIDLQPNQTIVDLGAGDGRIVIMAALLSQAQCIGVEIDPIRQKIANLIISILGLKSRANVKWWDLYDYDISNADLITMYLLQNTIQRLKKKFSLQFKPGARVVSFRFIIPGWQPALIDENMGIFVYEFEENQDK